MPELYFGLPSFSGVITLNSFESQISLPTPWFSSPTSFSYQIISPLFTIFPNTCIIIIKNAIITITVKYLINISLSTSAITHFYLTCPGDKFWTITPSDYLIFNQIVLNTITSMTILLHFHIYFLCSFRKWSELIKR